MIQAVRSRGVTRCGWRLGSTGTEDGPLVRCHEGGYEPSGTKMSGDAMTK
jgi:hypothetical protein